MKQHFFNSDTWTQCKHILFLMLSLCISSVAITQGVFMLLRLHYLLFALSVHQLLQVFSLSWSAYGYVVLSLFLIALGCFIGCVAIYDGCMGKQKQTLTLEAIENE